MSRRAELEGMAKRSAHAVRSVVGRKTGFVVFTFDFGPDGFVAYASNGDRADVIAMLREFLRDAEADERAEMS